MIQEFIARIMAVRDAVHKAHWTTGSYAQHQALGALYEALPGKLDEFVEVYQGAFGLVHEVPTYESKSPAVTKMLRNEVQWFTENKDEICKELGALENMLDDLEALFYKTIYKLEHLA